MQTSITRTFALAAIFVVATGLYWVIGQPAGTGRQGTPRWPTSDQLYATQGWSASPETVDGQDGGPSNTDVVTRTLRDGSGHSALFTIIASHQPQVYGAGGEAPFLGNGYLSGHVPEALAPLKSDGVQSFVAERGPERWLVMYAYGERRGLLGNGVRGWSMATLDGLLGQQNDYYKLYFATRWDDQDPNSAVALGQVAHELFTRVADWYAA